MKRILVVDDDEEMCEELSEFLGREGFKVDVAFDGVSACAQVEKEDYQLVVLDLKLPQLTGYDVLARIKKKGISAKVLILSGRPLAEILLDQDGVQKDQEEKVLEIADYIMNKPFAVKGFIEKVRELICE